MPVAPATQEAEAQESLEPRRWSLQWVEIAPLHCSLGDKSETLKNQNQKHKCQKNLFIALRVMSEPILKKDQKTLGGKN